MMIWNYCYNNCSWFFFKMLCVNHWVNAKSLTSLGPKCLGTFHHYLRVILRRIKQISMETHLLDACFQSDAYSCAAEVCRWVWRGWRGATNKETTWLVRRLTGLKEGWLTPLSSFLSLPSDSLSLFLSLSLSLSLFPALRSNRRKRDKDEGNFSKTATIYRK